jgi:hypothetical protein
MSTRNAFDDRIIGMVEKELNRKITEEEKEIVGIAFSIGFSHAESCFNDIIEYHGFKQE